MTEKTMVFKYNVDPSGNPISVKIKEIAQVSPLKHMIQLEQLPDELYGVTLLNEDNSMMKQVYKYEEIDKNPNSYYVNYTNGLIYFNSTQGTEKKVINYYGTGMELISAKRIFDEYYKADGTLVQQTLQELIDEGREAIELLGQFGGASSVIQALNQLVTEGNLVVEELKDKIQEAINVAGNEVVIINADDWAYNPTSKMYEHTINHTMNSKDLIIDCYNLTTGDFMLCGGKIVNNNSVLIKSETNIDLKVVLNARYYKATLTISDDIAREVVEARKTHETVGERLDDFDSQLDNITKHINSVEINVLYPPKELEPLIPNDESLEVATLNTQRLNNILNYYSSNLITLYFPKNVYAFIPTIRVKKNIRFKGDSTRNGTIFKDVSEISNLNPLILFSMSDDEITNSKVNRIWGGEIENIYITGNTQNHDCIHMIKTGWEGKVRNLWIENFNGRGIYLQDVYDTVWENVTIFNCGGLINDIPYYALELNQKGNTTNGQHFNILHIEKCRYILDIQGARHCYFVNSKFEQDYANDDSINPVLRFGANAREVGFTSCIFVGNHVNEYTNGVPYYIEGTTPNSTGGITTFTSCDFATGDVYGMKMLNTNGRVFKLDNCSVAHLSGDKDSIKLKDKSSITNSTFICRTLTDGTCQSISIGNAIFRDNDLQSSGTKPSTTTSILTTIDNNFTIENNYYSTQFDYKLDNTSKYLGLVSRRKDTIPTFSQGVIKSGKLDIGQNFYSLIKVNPSVNVDLTHITNYCNIGEEFIIYNTSPTYKITLKNVYGGFSANTGQIRTKTQNDLILNGDEFAILKWTGNVWFVIN